MKQVMIFVAGCLLIVSCNKPSEPVASFDIEKAKAGVTATNQKFIDALGRGDSVTTASCYHSEGMILAPNMEPISGSGIISFHSTAIKMGIGGIVVNSTEVWGNEENVYEVGNYELLLGKDKTTIDKGKYLRVWKQENGEWKLYRDMWNTNTPMPVPTSK